MKFLIVVSFLLLSYSSSFCQAKEAPCYDFNALFSKAVESFNKRDAAMLNSLLDFPMVINSMEIPADLDKDQRDLLQEARDVMKNNKERYYNDLKTIFSLVVEQFEEASKEKNWQMKYLGYRYHYSEADTTRPQSKLIVSVSVNDRKYEMVSRCYREKGCQYMVIPFDGSVTEAP